MKRIFLFLITNIAVVFVLSITFNVIMALMGPEVREAFMRDGIDWASLAIFSMVFGMGGAFISLLISKPMAKLAMHTWTIDGSEGETERWLVATVEKLARNAGVKMPEVAMYRGEANAFATGAFKNHALVAVSTGIVEQMNRSELEAVLGHEMSHVSNGDMVTMTLLQGVLNAVVLLLSRVVAFGVETALSGGKRENRRSYGGSWAYILTVYLMQFMLGIAASAIVCSYSRRREFAADAGSAKLLGSASAMISALQRLGGLEAGKMPQTLQAFGIGSSGKTSIFATHPSIEDRVEALRKWTPS